MRSPQYLIFVCILGATLAFQYRKGGGLGAPGGDVDLRNATTEWFEQSLDHFNRTDRRTWQQKYHINDEFYGGTDQSPVFLLLGGEGAISAKWMTQGSWIAYAKQYGALLFQLEHRYYGDSHPTDDLSTNNLQYLTSQQALEDLAVFIDAMNKKYGLSRGVKWIAFGGSYPGSLAAWLRLKYPHLVHGAMSASGPLLAQVDFPEYLGIVASSLATEHCEYCVTSIGEAIKQIEDLIDDSVNRNDLDNLLSLCDPIAESYDNEDDLATLFEKIADNFAYVVQYNKDNRQATTVSIDDVCNLMIDDSLGAEINRLAKVNEWILANTTESGCLDYKYEKIIEALRNESYDSPAATGERQWVYQTCTEFGFFQSSSWDPQIFGARFPVDYFVKICEDLFGSQFNRTFVDLGIDRTNIAYGGLDLALSNVVYVHGSVDPWHALGIWKTTNDAAPAIFIEGAAHCANMYDELDDDSSQLVEARRIIGELIGDWLDDN